MNSKGQRGHCIYNRQWELNSNYKGWLTAFKADRKKALCKCCQQMIDISNMGESVLKSHMKSERHKNNSRIGGEQPVTLSSFGFVSSGNRNSAEDRVDTLFFECMAGESYKTLFSVVKLFLVLSHGQATVERGFSINKEVEVKNLKEHTLVAQRIVCDHVNSVGGVLKVELSKPLLLSVKMSRQRYEKYLDQERQKKKTEQERSKRKCVLEEIDEVKKKKKRIDAEIKSLNDTADELCTKAEATAKLTFVIQANALRRSAKDKLNDLVSLDQN